MQDSEIKSLIPMECPHCGKTIVIEFITGTPKLTGGYTPSMIEDAKKKALQGIDALELSEEIKKPVVDWINNNDTIFGPNDVEDIIANLIKQKNESSQEA